MNFLYPTFLFALSALAIPIIVHLFNFRRFKKIYFPNVRFLKEVKEETQSKSRLKHLLILAARILAISSLILAFAQPFIPVAESDVIKGVQHVGIYIDNSFSMANVNENGRLLDDARNKAKEIIKAYSPNDKFLLTTNDFEGRHQRLASRDEIIEWIDEIKESPFHKTLDEVIIRQKDVLSLQSENKPFSYVLSDYQKSILDFNEFKNDTSISIRFVPITALSANNIYIDSIAFTSPYRQINQTDELNVKVVNKGDKKAENIPLKLLINGEQKAIASVSLEPNSSELVKLSFTINKAGWQNANIKITDYPVSYDDDFYFSFNVAEKINILSINGEKESVYINKLFAADNYFNFKNVSVKQINYSEFGEYSFIIINEVSSIASGLAQELMRFIKNGGSVLLIPSVKADLVSYNNFTQLLNASNYNSPDTVDTKCSRINTACKLYANVFDRVPENIDLPIVLTHYPLTYSTQTNYDWLLMMTNNKPFISLHSFQKGNLYLSAVSLDASFGNFARHAIFVPTLYKMALLSIPGTVLYYELSNNDAIELNGLKRQSDNLFKLVDEKSKTEIIPEIRFEEGNAKLFLYNQLQQAGNYKLIYSTNTEAILSFNYDRKESFTDYYSKQELEKWIDDKGFNNITILQSASGNLTQTIKKLNKGIQLWKLFIILTLVFLAIEVLLIKFYR
jgi:hypothetical protein